MLKTKAETLVNFFLGKADEGLKKLEYYKTRSTAKDKEQQIVNWQNHVDCCMDTIDVLEDYLDKVQ
jgi:hypothetical protein